MPGSTYEQLEQWRRINAIAEDAAKTEGLDPNIIKSMIRQESVFSTDAKSPKGASGVMQLMPATAEELGVTDVNDPEQNSRAGTKYFARLMKRYNGDVQTALAAYNAGMGNVDRGKASKFPETQNYITQITNGIQARSQPEQEVAETSPSVKLNLSQFDEPEKPGVPEENPEEPSMSSMLEQWRASKAPAAPAAKPEAPGFFSRLKNHPIDTIADELSTVGGAVGGLVGGVPGAAIGGAAGKGFTDLYNHARELPGAISDVVSNLSSKDPSVKAATLQGAQEGALGGVKGAALEGGIQGLTEGAGAVLSKGAKVVGKGLLKRAFKPSAEMLTKTPGLLEKIAAEGINPTGKGMETMEARTNEARALAEQLVADAGKVKVLPNGVKIRPKNIPVAEVTAALTKNPYGGDSTVDLIRSRAARSPLFDKLTDYITTVAKDNPFGFNYDQMLKIRRGEGAAAHDVFEGLLGGQPALTKQMAVDMEAGSRKALERRVKGFAEANDVTQEKLRVLEAVREAVKKREASVPRFYRHPNMSVPVLTALSLTHPAVGAGVVLTDVLTGQPLIDAVAGRALMRAAPAVPTAVRAGVTAARPRPVRKSRVDALYERYKAGREE